MTEETSPGKCCKPISFENLEIFCRDAELPATGTNDKGEDVIISKESMGDGYCYRLDTMQKNGWVRINRYHADGLIEETFER